MVGGILPRTELTDFGYNRVKLDEDNRLTLFWDRSGDKTTNMNVKR